MHPLAFFLLIIIHRNTDSVKEHQRKKSKDGHVKGENLVSSLLPQIVTGNTPKKVSTIQNSESAVLNVDAVEASTSVDGAKSTRTVIASTDYNDHRPRSSRSQVSWQKATLKTQKTLVESRIKKVENGTYLYGTYLHLYMYHLVIQLTVKWICANVYF